MKFTWKLPVVQPFLQELAKLAGTERDPMSLACYIP